MRAIIRFIMECLEALTDDEITAGDASTSSPRGAGTTS
jgi:hypothetical protein